MLGILVAEATRTDARHWVCLEHADGRMPNAQAPGRGLIDRLFGALEHEQAALDARVEAIRIAQHESRTEGDAEQRAKGQRQNA